MALSTEYVAKETASNLWRNRLMTIAAVLTVAVSLSLVGAALLLKQGAAQAEGVWQRGTHVMVWMRPKASSNEIAAIAKQLKTLPYVNQPCIFHSHEYDYLQAKRVIGPVYSEAGVSAAQTPTSFQCVPARLEDANAVVKKFSGQPEVLKVTTPLASIRAEEHAINVLQVVFIVVAIVLLISAAALILNTIRMAIFARRREVSVMKLVGATNWFIRLPYMSEGLAQGLLGSGIAAAIVYGLHEVLDHLGGTAPGSLLGQMRMTGWEVFATDVVVLVIGILIGTGGSAIAIRRFLDV